jgi:hypothetical protein
MWTQRSGGIMALLRMPWGQRLVSFGLLGLLDDDPTGRGWFGPSLSFTRGGGCGRCVRVMLSSEDAEERMRKAYKNVLETMREMPAGAVEACGS